MVPRVYIQISTTYIGQQSCPNKNIYVFIYIIKLLNLRNYLVQIIGCYWKIINANSQNIEIYSEGIAGKKPYLFPGKEFKYVSIAILKTPLGIMQGCYNIINNNGQAFHIKLPIFRLANPAIIN